MTPAFIHFRSFEYASYPPSVVDLSMANQTYQLNSIRRGKNPIDKYRSTKVNMGHSFDPQQFTDWTRAIIFFT
jgi:hypothetical protein